MEGKLDSLSSLHDYNRKALFDKIDGVRKIDNTYRATALIDVLSSAPERDKGIIKNYEKDEVMIRRVQCKGILRITRFFTLKGIARYLHEGKVFSYKNACAYFEIEPRDLEKEKLSEELSSIKMDNDKYNTKKLLKWLFEKRKSAKVLGESCTISKLLEFVDDLHIDDKEAINSAKLSLLHSLQQFDDVD